MFRSASGIFIVISIAIYLSADGELDTKPLIESLWQQGKSIYLPVIHPFSKGQLLFLQYLNDDQLVYNKYGILEPALDIRHLKPVRDLDVICTPLVGFDSVGHRLGMGGGYYDRTLSRWFSTGEGAKPIGIATGRRISAASLSRRRRGTLSTRSPYCD